MTAPVILWISLPHKGMPKNNAKRTYKIGAKDAKSRSTSASIKAQRNMSVSDIQDQLVRNSTGYVNSILHPFEVRGMRIPDPAPYPSTVGDSVMRYLPASVDDKTLLTRRVAGMCFGHDFGDGLGWTWTISSSDNKSIGWTHADHPHMSEFELNFQLMRTVSMGVRIVNLSTLVERGGALYVAYSTTSPAVSAQSATILEALKVSSECEVYDAARLSKEGMEAVYVPISMGAMITGDDKLGVAATSYRNPTAAITEEGIVWDTNIYIWIEGTTEQDLSIEFEQVHNWEAIPYPVTEFLFDRKTCSGSDDAKAVALAAVPTPAIETVGDSHHSLWSTVASVGTKVAKKVLGGVEGQVLGLARRGLAALSSALFGLDYEHHRVAVLMHCQHLSPAINKSVRGLSRREFMAHILAEIDKQSRSNPVDSPPLTLAQPPLVRARTRPNS